MPKTPLHGTKKLSKLDKVVTSMIGEPDYQEFTYEDAEVLIRKAYQRGVRNGRKQENNRWLGVRMRSGPI